MHRLPQKGPRQSSVDPVTLSQGGGAREAFLLMINVWYSKFVRANPNTPPPPPPPIPQPAPTTPQVVETIRREKPPVDRIGKVFDKLSCTPKECMKCVVSLLRDSAYQWLNTLVSVVPREKEFLELKQGRLTVTEYEREFVRLSKYTWEYVSTEAIMCKRFEDGLNKDIQLFFGILELKEFVVLLERACKAEELAKEKRKAMIKARDTRSRSMSKSFQS
ncbi:Retrotransposon gag domain-containing 1 [Gossypium australe]|uniref:Retrotransposon gag domain-containing 1 n=1 Tax=Gossypium australe TaxID=47621 RepID=A0A5B6VA69_9ROSI|nr:Retrotransposon gag domain-containing 1 [Gossypium australe]